MRVLFINNEGGGFADHIEVAEGSTVAQLFEQRLPGRKPEDYLIRVNRLPASADPVLRAARRLHEAWQARTVRGANDPTPVLERLGERQRPLQRAGRLLDKARRRGWFLAVPRLQVDLLGHGLPPELGNILLRQ